MYSARQYDLAIKQFRWTLDMDSSFWAAHLNLGLTCVQKGAFSEAVIELKKAVDLSNENTLAVASLGHAYALMGNRTEAQKLLSHLIQHSKQRYASSLQIAIVFAGLGEKEQAFQWLEKAYDERSVANNTGLKTDPRLDSLRSDPRFTELLTRVNLEK